MCKCSYVIVLVVDSRMNLQLQFPTVRLPRDYLIGIPFSWRLLSLGSGGTLSTQAFILLPPTEMTQLLHSPFLHEYLGFTPSLPHAALSGEPGRKFPLLAPYVSFVIDKAVLPKDDLCDFATNPLDVAITTNNKRKTEAKRE
mmetsp:Transcript_33441/g.51262  ORF Transcript_33441/g.51262 Transcript_33441/m.51262 type:complete len:142 (+) Transcript_33441:1197-1622(+)